VRTDNRVGPDLHIGSDLRPRIYNGRRMNLQSTPASLKLK
jgi:hypothetical protein